MGCVAGWVYQQRSEYRQVKIIHHASTDANYAKLNKRVKQQHEKKPVSNLLSMQSVGFDQTLNKFIEIFISLHEKNVEETISVAINDSSDVRCLDLYLINIFTKSTKAERCTDIKFKLTLYCLSVTVEDLNF